MKILNLGHDPEQKGVYLCDCDCKGHGKIVEKPKAQISQKEIEKNNKTKKVA